jgi:two-component system sensor histidine kinase EvgS
MLVKLTGLAIVFAVPTHAADVELTHATRQWLQGHPTIVVATYAEGYPPFESPVDGRAEGLAPDYVRLLATGLGLDVRWRNYADWPSTLAALERGEIDLVMDVAPTPQREAKLKLGRPYYEAVPVLAIRRGDSRIARMGDLAGRIVATAAGHAEEEALRRYVPSAVVQTTPSLASSLERLDDGRADAVLGDPKALKAAIDRLGVGGRVHLGPTAALPIATLSFAVDADGDRLPLLEAMDAAFAALTPDEHARVRVPWLGDETRTSGSLPDVPLSDEERRWLSTLPVLRLGIDPTATPLSMTDGDGQAEGLSIDYLDLALHALGVRTRTVATADWSDTVRAATAGDVDVLAAASARNVELGKGFVFTAPYVDFPVMIVAREDFPTLTDMRDLAGLRFAANRAQGAVAAAVDALPRGTLVPVRTVGEGLRAVANGDADVYVGDIATAEALIRRDYPARLKLAAATDERAALSIAVSQRYAALAPLIDRALIRLPERRALAIRNTWLRSEYTWGGSWREIARKVGPAGVLIMLLLLTVSYAYVRLRRETRLRLRSEAQLADVTRHIPAVVYRFLYHADGRLTFTYVGGHPEPIFGVGAETFMRDERSAFARVDRRDQASLMAAVAHTAATLEPMHTELRVRDTVPERWVASHALARRVADAVEFTGYWIDVSDRHEQSTQLAAAKSAAEAATQAKSRFLATMSHEIRTPMHGILGMLEMLGDTELDEAQRRLLDTAETSAEALLQILDDVLDFSRIEAGRIELEPTAVDVRQLLTAVLDLFAWQAARKGLRVDRRIDDRLASALVVDGTRLRQILLNLVSNAVKFTERGSVGLSVDVLATSDREQSVRFTVSDTGIGVDDADIARLFSPFNQAEASTTRRFGGSGLGLTISRSLVELLGGDIKLQGRPGEGTQVTVDLDLDVAACGADDTGRPAPVVSMATTPLDVLVAEDNPVNRELVAAQLERLGHRCRVARDGAEALALVDDGPVDVLLTDLHMPAMDGYALTRALRSRGATMRIVVMTADVMAAERDRCMAVGVDAFVAKPLRMAALRDAVAPSTTSPAHERPAGWDIELWRETFGDLGVVPLMVARFEASLNEDVGRLSLPCTAREAAAWTHRILGGMRIFGDSPEAATLEAREREWRAMEPDAPVASLAPVLPPLQCFVLRLRDAAAHAMAN